MAERISAAGEGDPLAAFFTATLSFVSNVTKDMVKACGNDPDADLIQANASLVQNHLQKLFARTSEVYSGANQATRATVAEYLALADGVFMASTGEKTARSSIAKGLFGGGFFSWISKYLTEIKKIIRFIVTLIFRRVPDWLEDLLVLIDEIWGMISELLGGVFGFNRREIAKDISSGEINSLNEVAAMQRLRAVSRELDRSDDE